MCTPGAFGKDHYDTDARLLHKSLGHTAALPEAKRAEFLATNRMWDDYLAAREQGNFAEAAKVFGDPPDPPGPPAPRGPGGGHQ